MILIIDFVNLLIFRDDEYFNQTWIPHVKDKKDISFKTINLENIFEDISLYCTNVRYLKICIFYINNFPAFITVFLFFEQTFIL
jgi:hypothetical protein